MTSEDIILGIGLIVMIAVGCQILAPWLRVPALVLLLPTGFLAGIYLTPVDPEAIFGAAFTPMVNLAVAIILFHGGLELFDAPVERTDHVIVSRLVWGGALITWVVATVAAVLLLGFSAQLALLLGAIVIVSGPTVVGPLLGFVRPKARIRRILAWEGTLIDPVGALTAVIVFQAVQASGEASIAGGIQRFLLSMGVGALTAVLGLALIWAGLRLTGDNRVLGTEVLLGGVVGAAALANYLTDDAGLVTAVSMGMLARLVVGERLEVVRPFFDTVVSLSIGVLFVSISSLVTPDSVGEVLWGALGIVAVLVLLVRPVVAWLMTVGTTLSRNERLFMGWMAPRGIVAASTAASFGATLVATGVDGGDQLLPATFVIIAGTVAIYSFTAVPVANLLKVRQPDSVESSPAPSG